MHSTSMSTPQVETPSPPVEKRIQLDLTNY